MTLAECCFDSGGIGAEVAVARAPDVPVRDVSLAATLFGESASRVVVSATAASVDAVLGYAGDACVRQP